EVESKNCILSHAQLENGLSVLVDDKLNSLRLEDGLKLFQPCYGIGAAQLHHMGGPFLQLDLQLRWIEIAEFADEDNALLGIIQAFAIVFEPTSQQLKWLRFGLRFSILGAVDLWNQRGLRFEFCNWIVQE